MSTSEGKKKTGAQPMTDSKRGGPNRGQGPKNLSGARGASPVLRVRVPTEMMAEAERKAAAAGMDLADWVRALIAGAPHSSPDNWAHKALLLMDDAETLVRFAAVNMPDAEKYTKAANAFWDACRILAKDSERLRSTPSHTRINKDDCHDESQP